jgi:hypothetical protein
MSGDDMVGSALGPTHGQGWDGGHRRHIPRQRGHRRGAATGGQPALTRERREEADVLHLATTGRLTRDGDVWKGTEAHEVGPTRTRGGGEFFLFF